MIFVWPTVLWALAVFGGGIALSLQRGHQTWSWILASAFVLAMIGFAVYLARVRVYTDADLEKMPGLDKSVLEGKKRMIFFQ